MYGLMYFIKITFPSYVPDILNVKGGFIAYNFDSVSHN